MDYVQCQVFYIKLLQSAAIVNTSKKRYKGICETTFKKRYANYEKPFNLIKSKNRIYRTLEFKTKTTSPETYMGNQRTV